MKHKYPHYGGIAPHGKSETSKKAAEAITGSTKTIRKKVEKLLLEVGYAGATDCELDRYFECTNSSVRTRRRELTMDGKCVDSGEKRKTDSGLEAIVWKHVKHTQGQLLIPEGKKQRQQSSNTMELRQHILRGDILHGVLSEILRKFSEERFCHFCHQPIEHHADYCVLKRAEKVVHKDSRLGKDR